ncbi:hypothetical protein BsWGS_03830 [Bradybaena similaris]
MYLTLTLFAATASLLTGVSTQATNKATIDEPVRSTSLASLHSGLGDDHAHQNHFSNLESETSKVPAFVNDGVGLIRNRKLQIQGSTIYERDKTFVKNRSSTQAPSELKSNHNLYNNTSYNVPSPKLLSDDTRTDQRNRLAKKAVPASYSSTSNGNDGKVNNASHKAKHLQDNAGMVRVNKVQRKDGLNHESGLLLAPHYTKTGFQDKENRFGGQKINCSCDNTICNYSYCNLTSVPRHLNPNITELLLAGNNISVLPNNGFFRYRFLENLVLSHNSISVVDVGAFNGLSRLTSLDLFYNLIGRYTDIADQVFKPLKSLKTLQLSANDFPCNSFPPKYDRFLAYLTNLEELYIDNYGNQEYGPGFKSMTSLRNLTFGCLCSFGHVSNTSFINFQQITSLDISACNVHGNAIDVGAFVHLRNLTTLDISQNKGFNMDYLPRFLRGLQSLKVLRMDTIVEPASINFINISLTEYLPRTLTTLSARENNIISLDREAFLHLPTSLQFVDLSDNFMMVQAQYFPLDRLKELEVLLVNTKRKECLSNDSNTLYFKTGSYSDNRQLKTRMKRQTNANKNAAGFQLRDLKIPGKLKRIQINVKSMHESFLRNLDNRNNLEEIDMRCSEIPNFDFLNLFNLPKLRYLNLGRSSVRKLSIPTMYEIPPIEVLILESNRLNDFLKGLEFSFKGLNNVSYLDLSLNKINSLKRDLFKWLDKLEYLRLDGNPLASFDANISNMEQLKLLSISNTGLPYLPSQVRSHIDHLCQARPIQITVDMSGCPIQCDCFNLDFLKWMVKSPAFDQNFAGYKCRYSDASFKYILDGYEETIRNLDKQCAKNYPVFLVILAATMVLVCAVTGTVVYRFRWKIRYLYYAAYLKVMDANREERREFKYDVFVAYDSEDGSFVKRNLAPELENRDLKLLIHSRDFVAGTYIASNIVMAVAESRKTLVVLTRNLLESTWCNYEIQMATMEAVHTGRPVLVFLLKENIPNRQLDVELLRYIKSNTYLPYPGPEEEGDEEIMKKFYDKLAHDLKC